MSTERASKPSCRLCTYLERKLAKWRNGIHKKIDNLNLRHSFGHTYERLDVYNSFPVPTSPAQNNFNNAPGPFPEPAPPPGWIRPQKLDFYEASGSNHTSNQNSEYFDAENPEEYRLQHQITNYEDFHRRQDQFAGHSLGDQLAARLKGDLLLDTPTSDLHEFDPWKEFSNDPEEILWSDAVDQHQTENNSTSTPFQYGPMMDQLHQTENNSTSTPFHYGPVMDQQTPFHYGPIMDQLHQTENNTTSTPFQYEQVMDQQHQTANNNLSGVQYGSMMTGETGESRESMMDTGTSNCHKYILDPVAEEAPPGTMRRKLTKFYDLYWANKRDVLGEPIGAHGSSGRRGRGFRVMGRILCIAIRLKGRTILRRMPRKRAYCTTTSSLGQNRGQCSRQQLYTKRMRTAASASVISDESRSTKYKGVSCRANGKWTAEIRVSRTKEKCWSGTFETEVHAALAADAGMHHCSNVRKKKFNFPALVQHMGPSQYQAVYALFETGEKEQARAKVKDLAFAHSNTFAPSLLHH